MSEGQYSPEIQATSTEETHSLPSALLHDLRTPLNQIIGYSEMLEEQAQDEGREDFAGDLLKIQTAAKQLLGQINTRLVPHGSANRELTATFASPVLTSGYVADRFDGVPLSEPSSAGEASGLLLVVDDNETNRDVLSLRLKRQGYLVETAANGREALRMVQEKPFDLMLLDIMMPEMDGYEVLKQLKADSDLRHLPVIMISALSELDSVVHCIEMGAEDYLPKPFNPTVLKARVGACLEKKRSRDREMLLFEQLQENYQRLQELEKMRDDLTHMIVHDLRTPLSSLIVGLQLMQDLAPIADAQKECYDIAVRGSERLLNLINDLLDISKMESGTFELELAPLGVPTLLESSIEQISSSARDKQIALGQEVGAHSALLIADEDKLRRVIVNLLGNAIKFTPANGTITVSANRHVQEEESSLLFSVSDTGEGIPEESFARIFEKFGQVESRRSGRRMSTGLGLTFCKMAVEAHGGRIWVESVLGEGTTFFFSIPLREEV